MLTSKLTNFTLLKNSTNYRYFFNLSKLRKLSTQRTEELINFQKPQKSNKVRDGDNSKSRALLTNLNSTEVTRIIEDYQNLKNNKLIGKTSGNVVSSPGVNLTSIKENLLVSEDHGQNLDNFSIDNLTDSHSKEDLDDGLSSGSDKSVKRFKPLDLVASGPNLALVLSINNNSILSINFQGEIQALKPLNVRIHIPNPFKNFYWLSSKKLQEPIQQFLANPAKVEEFLPHSIQLVKQLESSTRSFSIKNWWKLSSTWEEYYLRKGYKQINLTDLMKNILKVENPSPIELLGAYRYFREEQLHYYFNPDDFNLLQFYSKEFVNRVNSIKMKLLNNDPSLLEFWGKAKIITNYSRAKYGKGYNLDLIDEGFKAYHPDNNQFNSIDNNEEEITIKESELPKLNSSDLEFIRLIQDFIMVDKFGLCHNLVPLVSSLLKPLGHYHYFYAPSAAEFLRDLGIYSPLENLNFLHPNLTLNNMVNESEWGINQFTSENNKDNVWDNIEDDCKEIRKDFKDLRVYTIDSESANEIDDGVSIEYDNPSRPYEGGGWLRVHIADPTIAINSPQSPLFKQLLNQPQTSYLPNQIIPMLPHWLSYGMCSLGESLDYKFRYVMTFSIRFEKDNQLDFSKIEVIPGKVNNLVKISYSEVDKLMGINSTKDSSIFTYPLDLKDNNNNNEQVNREKVNKNYDNKVILKDLEFIKNLIKGHLSERINNGALTTFFPKPFIQIEGNPQTQTNINDPELSQSFPDFTKFNNEPIIRYELDKSTRNPNELNSNSIVAECMILAGRIASKFSEINKLPSLYVNQLPPNFKELSLYDKSLYKKIIDNQGGGQISSQEFINFRSLTNAATTSLNPIGHNLMGIKGGYLRVTSPLRRFIDILNHLQFKNYLLGKPLINSKTLVDFNNLINIKSYRLNMLKKSTEKFFTLELLNYYNNLIQRKPKEFFTGEGNRNKLIKFIGIERSDKKVKKLDISDYSNLSTIDLKSKKYLILECELIQFELKSNSWQIYLTDLGIFSTLKLTTTDNGLNSGDKKFVKLTQLIRDLNLVEFELIE